MRTCCILLYKHLLSKTILIFRNSNTSDVTLIFNNQKLSAHKEVLASNCDYFDRMFTSSFKEQDQDTFEINFTSVSYETLNSLIVYFYSSKLVITELNVQVILQFFNYCIHKL